MFTRKMPRPIPAEALLILSPMILMAGETNSLNFRGGISPFYIPAKGPLLLLGGGTPICTRCL